MDLGGLGEAVRGVDVDNMVQGGSTLGFSETIKYFDENIEVGGGSLTYSNSGWHCRWIVGWG